MRDKGEYEIPRAKPDIYCHVMAKICYDKKGAVTARNLRMKNSRLKLRVYCCPECGFWHLTKSDLSYYNH